MSGDYQDFTQGSASPRRPLSANPTVVPASGQATVNVPIDATVHALGIVLQPAAGNTIAPGMRVVGHQTGADYANESGSRIASGYFVIAGYSSADTSVDVTVFAADTDTSVWVDLITEAQAVWTQPMADSLVTQPVNISQVSGTGLATPPTTMGFSVPVALPTDQVPSARTQPQSIAHGAYAAVGAAALIANGVGAATYVWSVTMATNGGAGLYLIGFITNGGTDVMDLALGAGQSVTFSGHGAPWSAEANNSIRVNVQSLPAGGAIYVTAEYSTV
jgi:hypothetical protein